MTQDMDLSGFTGDGIMREIERIGTNVGPDLAPKIDLSIDQIQDHLHAPKGKLRFLVVLFFCSTFTLFIWVSILIFFSYLYR